MVTIHPFILIFQPNLVLKLKSFFKLQKQKSTKFINQEQNCSWYLEVIILHWCLVIHRYMMNPKTKPPPRKCITYFGVSHVPSDSLVPLTPNQCLSTRPTVSTVLCEYTALWILMSWCSSTKPSVSKVLMKRLLYWTNSYQKITTRLDFL